MSPPRCFPNALQPVSLDKDALKHALADIRAAISTSLNILRQHSLASTNSNDNLDSLYTGDSGIALMFLRIAVQYEMAGMEDCLSSDFRSQLPSIISRLLPSLRPHHPRAGHLSPLDSVVGPALVYVLASLSFPSLAKSGETPSEKEYEDDDWIAATKTLERAVQVAAEDDSLGGDEVLYGRAGLLWGMLNLHVWLVPYTQTSSRRNEDLAQVVGGSLIEEIMDEILEAGDTGAQMYARSNEETGLPLMWAWHGKYYLGAIHGVAGILTVLLQAPRELVKRRLHLISSCISALCALASQNGGHIPSSLPAHPRSHNLVQICHGSPGLLLLLATFRARFPREWKPDWDAAEALASEAVWKEGLVTKGLGVCHGVAGNAWPWLLQARALKETPEADIPLSRALAFLLHARGLPPLRSPSGAPSPYRTPDHPYSLFEGLAGTVCAWVDACVIIRERLARFEEPGKGETAGSDDGSRGLVLGIPGLGGARVHGIL